MIDRRQILGAGALAGPVLSHPAAARPANPRYQAAAAVLNPIAAASKSPGIAVTVVQGGKTLAVHAWGMASLPFAAPVTDRTLFHLGSLGKHVTAIAVLQLKDSGAITLDAPIGRYVKDLPQVCADLPIRALLHQTTGLKDYTDSLQDFDRPMARADMIQAMSSAPPAFEVGRAWAYSNSNYILLGWLIEAVTGQGYADYVARHVLGPAQTPSARPDAAGEIIRGRAEPYGLEGDRFVHEAWSDSKVSQSSDGGLLFAPRDFAPWCAALDRHRLVSPGAWAEALSPVTSRAGRAIPYGCGWFLDRLQGQDYHMHTGGVPGYGAIFIRLPGRDISVAVTTNIAGTLKTLRQLAWTALESYAPGSTHLTLKPIARDPADRTLVRFLEAGNGVKADPDLMSEELLAVYASPLTRPRALLGHKPPVEAVPIEEYAVTGGRMRRYRVHSAEKSVVLLAGFDDRNRMFWVGNI